MYPGLKNILRVMGAGCFLLGIILLADCASKQGPASPGPTPVTFNWLDASWADQIYNGNISNTISLDLQVNGAPCTSVGVTVTGGGVTVAVPFPTGSASPCPGGCNYSNYFNYSPGIFTSGVSYVFSTTYNGQTASVTLVAPGNFSPVTDTTTPYNGAITYFSWGGAFTNGYVSLQETGPSTGNDNSTFFTSGTTSMALPTGASTTVLGYSASAPSTYALNQVILNSVPGPAGSSGSVTIENYISEPLTLN